MNGLKNIHNSVKCIACFNIVVEVQVFAVVVVFVSCKFLLCDNLTVFP